MSSPWYETFFGRDYLDAYAYQFSDERAEREVAFAERALGLTKGQSVLDLCCGPGRHSLLLARHGLDVTGLDLSSEYVESLAASAKREGLPIRTVRADMREIPPDRTYDAVINMFSSFGYLESDAEDAKVLAAVSRVLKPGGRLLMDLLNREWVLANMQPHDWHESTDGTIYLERREVDLAASRNHVSFTVISPDGKRREVVGHHFRLYTLTEVIGMLRTAGLTYEASYGGFEGEAYGVGTRRMIMVARKG